MQAEEERLAQLSLLRGSGGGQAQFMAQVLLRQKHSPTN